MADVHVQWSIWSVSWPDDKRGSKFRPAVVFSATEYNAAGDVCFAKISGSDPAGVARFPLPKSMPGFALTGLTKDSFVHTEDVRWVKASDIHEQVGEMPLQAVKILACNLRIPPRPPARK